MGDSQLCMAHSAIDKELSEQNNAKKSAEITLHCQSCGASLPRAIVLNAPWAHANLNDTKRHAAAGGHGPGHDRQHLGPVQLDDGHAAAAAAAAARP